MELKIVIFQLEDVVEDVQDWENHIVLRVPPDVVDKVGVRKNAKIKFLNTFPERYKFLGIALKISRTPDFQILSKTI